MNSGLSNEAKKVEILGYLTNLVIESNTKPCGVINVCIPQVTGSDFNNNIDNLRNEVLTEQFEIK